MRGVENAFCIIITILEAKFFSNNLSVIGDLKIQLWYSYMIKHTWKVILTFYSMEKYHCGALKIKTRESVFDSYLHVIITYAPTHIKRVRD